MPPSKKLGYLAVLGSMLLAPFVVERMSSREMIYSYSTTGAKGAAHVPSLTNLIFKEREPIDLLIVGSSRIWVGLIPRQIEDHLQEIYGRPFTVRTMAQNWCGEDIHLTLLKDLLARRTVKNVLLGTTNCTPTPIHQALYELWPDGLLPALPNRISLLGQYGIRMYEAPRKLLGHLRSNGSIQPVQTEVDPLYGNLEAKRHMLSEPFEPMALKPLSDSATQNTAIAYDYDGDDIYLEKIAQLLLDYHVQPIWINTFDLGRENVAHLARAVEKRPHDPRIAVSTEKLFAQYSDEDLKRLFYNSTHLNQTGARLLTAAILPDLVTAMKVSRETR